MKKVIVILCMFTACAAFSASISSEILGLASRTTLSLDESTLLQAKAELDAPAGLLAASVLFACDNEKFRPVFRKRCGYDYEMKRVVVTRKELQQKVSQHLSPLGEISELEKDFQTYYFLKKSGYTYLRDDGSEFWVEKVASYASFFGLAKARKESDRTSFASKLFLESDKKDGPSRPHGPEPAETEGLTMR